MFSLKFRDALPSIVADELDNLVNKISGFLRISFNEDGSLIGSNPLLNVVPVGAWIGWGTNSAPTGWLLCDGSQKNRVAYKGLFDTIGTTYGAGDGSTTFNLPDMRGKFLLGKAATGTGSALAGSGGLLDHTHNGVLSGSTAGATASISGTTGSESAHTHSYSGNTSGVANNPVAPVFSASGAPPFSLDSGHDHTYSGTTGAGSAHSHGVGSLGVDSHSHGAGSLSVSNNTANPPYLVANYIIFAGV